MVLNSPDGCAKKSSAISRFLSPLNTSANSDAQIHAALSPSTVSTVAPPPPPPLIFEQVANRTPKRWKSGGRSLRGGSRGLDSTTTTALGKQKRERGARRRATTGGSVALRQRLFLLICGAGGKGKFPSSAASPSPRRGPKVYTFSLSTFASCIGDRCGSQVERNRRWDENGFRLVFGRQK